MTAMTVLVRLSYGTMLPDGSPCWVYQAADGRWLTVQDGPGFSPPIWLSASVGKDGTLALLPGPLPPGPAAPGSLEGSSTTTATPVPEWVLRVVAWALVALGVVSFLVARTRDDLGSQLALIALALAFVVGADQTWRRMRAQRAAAGGTPPRVRATEGEPGSEET
jgi:hypothetical protein